jgi:antitoxin VapB
MTRTKLFRSNRSQAVRLPKGLAFPDSVKEVRIVREGQRRVIVPSSAVWDDFFGSYIVDSLKVVRNLFVVWSVVFCSLWIHVANASALPLYLQWDWLPLYPTNTRMDPSAGFRMLSGTWGRGAISTQKYNFSFNSMANALTASLLRSSLPDVIIIPVSENPIWSASTLSNFDGVSRPALCNARINSIANVLFSWSSSYAITLTGIPANFDMTNDNSFCSAPPATIRRLVARIVAISNLDSSVTISDRCRFPISPSIANCPIEANSSIARPQSKMLQPQATTWIGSPSFSMNTPTITNNVPSRNNGMKISAFDHSSDGVPNWLRDTESILYPLAVAASIGALLFRSCLRRNKGSGADGSMYSK